MADWLQKPGIVQEQIDDYRASQKAAYARMRAFAAELQRLQAELRMEDPTYKGNYFIERNVKAAQERATQITNNLDYADEKQVDRQRIVDQAHKVIEQKSAAEIATNPEKLSWAELKKRFREVKARTPASMKRSKDKQRDIDNDRDPSDER